MLTIYICFLAGGAVLPITSFLLGFIHNLMDTDVDADLDADAHLDVDTDVDVDTEFDVNTDADVDTELDINPDAGINAGIELDSEININSDTDMDSDTNVGHSSDLNQNISNMPDAHVGIGADSASMLSIAFYPTSLMSLATLAIVFGAVGSVMTLTGKGAIFTLIIATITGYVASITVQTIIKTLKKVQTRSSGIYENELMLYDGTVVDTILPGQMGSVSFITLSNIRVNYPAKCTDESLRLVTGRVVKVKEIKNGIFIVEPKNKYE